MKYTLLIPTLNEIACLPQTMPTLPEHLFEQIIILDAGSTDGTIEWARQNGFRIIDSRINSYFDVGANRFDWLLEYKKMIFIGEIGFRPRYLKVWPYIKGDAVIYFTPDGNSPVEALPRFIEEMEKGYDLVIGSRYLHKSRSDDDDAVTCFGNWLFRTVVNVLNQGAYAPHMTDPMIMYRALKRDLPHRLVIDTPGKLWIEKLLGVYELDWIPLMSARALRFSCFRPYVPPDQCHTSATRRAAKNIHWKEISVEEPARIAGKRKMKPWSWGAVYMTQIIGDMFRRG